jgi:hypothetical protein
MMNTERDPITAALAAIRSESTEQRRWNEWVHGSDYTIRRAMSLTTLAQLSKDVAA